MKESTGLVESRLAEGKDSDEKLVRPAILVHSGPEGEGVTYQSMDGETKPFDAERIKRIVENQNALLEKLAGEYGGWDKMPDGAFPPLLDSHDPNSSHNVLGRLTSKLRFEIRDVPKVGKNVACAVTDLTFLGKDNVSKVKDGRVYHLSVGIDENADTLGETSAVVEPAAPGAMLLSKGKQTSKGASEMSKKSLAASKARLTKLTDMKESLTKLSTKLVASGEGVRLAKVQGEISGRLTRLMKSGKLTPAEVKKIDLKKLSALPTEAIDTLMSTYEALEPKIIAGQRGSSDPSATVDFAGIGKELERKQMTRLKAEVRGELKKMGAKLKSADDEADQDHGKGHEMGKKLADEASEEHRAKKLADEASEQHRAGAAPEHIEKLKQHLAAVHGHLAAGNIEEAKKAHEELMKHCMEHHMAAKKHMSGVDEVKSEDYKLAMEHLEGELDEVKTNLARMAGMVDELMSSESEEGEALESAPPAPQEQQPGVKA